ncbi:MAG: hypothetical protein NT093_04025 [Candidatus Moranbacteria bacterium]|nr:hypothetical protein [Candidatus Moranbacteria bacterium]
MAIKIIRCSGRDKNPPVAYRGSITPEALEAPIKYYPLLLVVFRLFDGEKGSDDTSLEKNN